MLAGLGKVPLHVRVHKLCGVRAARALKVTLDDITVDDALLYIRIASLCSREKG